jgi:hypothetical protein
MHHVLQPVRPVRTVPDLIIHDAVSHDATRGLPSPTMRPAVTFVNYVYTVELGYNVMEGTVFCVVINECCYN